jgi:DNA-binding SARP family transcriptional activator/TolB-like protein/Flp pilus assembly protein TadD
VESKAAPSAAGLRIAMLGPMSLTRDGEPLAMPPSRKLRGLLAYLALAPRAQPRSALCELLWEAPSDPRGELRWCLSRLRSLLDSPGRRRVLTGDDAVWLELDDCLVDAVAVLRASAEGLDTLAPDRLRDVEGLFRGDLLDGVDFERSPAFDGWLVAQRRRLRDVHAALLRRLAAVATGDEVLERLERWLELEPFELDAHRMLLAELALRGRIRDAEAHLAATARRFAADGLDRTALEAAWRQARERPRAGGAEAADGTGSEGIVVTSTRPDEAPATPRRASVAVMPFIDATQPQAARGGLADALAHDVITRLAKLRSMFVIAQGSVFALHERGLPPAEAARLLAVDFVVGGSVRREQGRIAVTVELTETRNGRIVWAEVFDLRDADTFLVLDAVVNRIVASIASEIETIERNRAVLKPPNSLDAWESLHRGLWHMYRFTQAENGEAMRFFSEAVRLDPTFARAYAGLSFTHWQNAFQGWGDRAREIDLAYRTAGTSLMVDDRDPAAHWAMGRALWLRNDMAGAIAEIEQSIDLSPNFALAHYTLAFVRSQAGDPREAILSVDRSRELSPFDPLLFGMLGSRAMAHVRLGEFEQAGEWGAKAAARPNAHPHIVAIAAYSLALAGDLERARAHAGRLRQAVPDYDVADFFQAFKMDADGEAAFRRGAKRVGMG